MSLFKSSVPNTWISGQVAIKLLRDHVTPGEIQATFENPEAVCECGQPKASMAKKACERCAYLESYSAKYDRVVERAIMEALSEGSELSMSSLLVDLGHERKLVKSTLRRLMLEGKITGRQADRARWFYRLGV